MSHEHFEFLAIDHRLNRAQREDLRRLSSRAVISSARCVVVHNYSSFRGDPLAVLAAHFDVLCYVADWGTRRLALRLPAELLSPAERAAYGLEKLGRAQVREGALIIVLEHTDPYAAEWISNSPEWPDRLRDVRKLLLQGDQRALYLGWLAALGDEAEDVVSFDDDAPAPPLPAGMGDLPEPLVALRKFLRVEPFLLAAAAEQSAACGRRDEASVVDWLAEQPEKHKDVWLAQVMTGEHAAVQAQIARGMQADRRDATVATGPRTVGALRARAEALRAVAAEEADRAKAAAARRAQIAAATAQEARVRRLATRGEVAWRDVETFIAERNPAGYDQAVALLLDLRELARREGTEEAFAARLAGVGEVHRRKVTFVARLRAAGLG